MEYYGLREGNDIDFVVSEEDYNALAKKHPDSKKELFGDLGLVIDDFEFWISICLFDYKKLNQDAVDQGEYLVISLEKLLLLKALGMSKSEKYKKDLELIVKKILDIQYGKDEI